MIPNIKLTPDIKLSVRQTFGIESDMEIEGFSKKSEFVPEIDKGYRFDKDTHFSSFVWFSFTKEFWSKVIMELGKSLI